MPPPTPSRTDRTRKLGLAAAAATAVMLVAGLLILMVVNPTQTTAPPRPSEALDSEAVVDLDDPGIVTEGGLVQLTDPDDPEAVQAEVRYESIDPVATGRYEVTEPAAWIFLDDGRRAHVRAAGGAVTMIGEDRPQVDSGMLVGGVRILLFPAAAEPDETDPDPSLADLRADVVISPVVRSKPRVSTSARTAPRSIRACSSAACASCYSLPRLSPTRPTRTRRSPTSAPTSKPSAST